MEEPKRPWPPGKWQYDAKIERRYIYKFTQSLREDEDDWDDDEEEKEPAPLKPIEKVDLAWLLTQVPEGIKLSNIKIDFDYHASSMSYENHWIGFYYEVKVPSRYAEYKQAMAQHELDLAQYEKDLEAYKDWQIKQAEERLAELKRKK